VADVDPANMSMKDLPPITPGEIRLGRIRQLVRAEKPVILEVGANDGTQSLQFLDLFPAAVIYAFEPDPRAADKFKSRVTSPRVTLFEYALGSFDGKAEFHVSSGLPPGMSPKDVARYPTGWDRSGSLRTPKNHSKIWPWCKFEATIAVQVRRLDSWAKESGVGTVDFLWADVQGAEGDLILGGPDTLARTRYVYTEYSNDEWYEGQATLGQIIDMMPNFTILDLYPMDVLLKNRAL
jgi:FkbM family methyltransferase